MVIGLVTCARSTRSDGPDVVISTSCATSSDNADLISELWLVAMDAVLSWPLRPRLPTALVAVGARRSSGRPDQGSACGTQSQRTTRQQLLREPDRGQPGNPMGQGVRCSGEAMGRSCRETISCRSGRFWCADTAGGRASCPGAGPSDHGAQPSPSRRRWPLSCRRREPATGRRAASDGSTVISGRDPMQTGDDPA